MSLDVHLSRKRWISYDGGITHTEENEEVYWANITHNLGKMADKAGIYKALWRPEEIDAVFACDIIEIVERGLTDLKDDPAYFKKFDSPNGWGKYDHFVPFVEKYLEALKKYSQAIINISR